MPDFLLEIGTEEVPASAVVPALEQLAGGFRELLARERIGAGEVRSYGTPRRLVVYVEGAAPRQEDALLQQRGPTRSVAFDKEGKPTGAAIGFARKFGVTPEQLQVRQTDGGEYVYAEQQVAGKPSAEVLGAAIPGLLSTLSFPKFMRRGEGRFRFSRPIRWILALLGAEVVPLEVAGIRSGRESWGHRFLPVAGTACAHRLAVERAEVYFDRMRDAQVVVDAEARRQRITAEGDRLAAAEGVRVVWDEALIHDVVYTAEYPTPFVGRFGDEYLELPRPVLVSAMKKHQRYFTLENPDGSLAPRFLAVRNGGEHGLDVVREGNERVLIFRFNDARHHFTEDRKSSLDEFRERLQRIVFMERLGTMWDKSERLEAVVAGLCWELGRDDLRDTAARAAALCKADLATHMVAELPELQGVIGREYAVLEGVPAEIAEAIGEHYLPRAAGDAVPESLLGRLLALADRLDLLAAAFSLGHLSTGSSDPFGLRRAAGGVVSLLQVMSPELDLSALIDRTLESYRGKPYYEAAQPALAGKVRTEILALLRPRVEAVLAEDGVRLDLIQAALDAGFDSIPRTLDRAWFLQRMSTEPSWEAAVAVGTRIRNILKPTDADPAAADLARLEHPTEKQLLAEFQARETELTTAVETQDWPDAWALWDALRPAIDQFFLDVLVNVEEPDLRAARLGLLRELDTTFTALADFSKIADAG